MVLGLLTKARITRFLWEVAGLLSSFMLVFLNLASLSVTRQFFATLFLAFSVGLCLPSVVADLTKLTNFDNRGRVMGIVGFCSFFTIAMASVLGPSILIAIKSCELVLFALCGFTLIRSIEENYVKVGGWTVCALFLVWLLFTAGDSIASSTIFLKVGHLMEVRMRVFTIMVGLPSMLLACFLFDYYERKPFILFSYILLAVEYLLISLFSPALYFYPIIDGLAWGFLTLFFTFIVWADISPLNERERFFTLGLAAPMLANWMVRIHSYALSAFQFRHIFPVTSIMLFLAGFALLLVPETLPREVVVKKAMDRYVKKAKKLRETRR